MIVDQYEQQIINAIVNDLDPNAVCTSIGLCPGSNCAICTMIIQTLQNILPSNTSVVFLFPIIGIIWPIIGSHQGSFGWYL